MDSTERTSASHDPLHAGSLDRCGIGRSADALGEGGRIYVTGELATLGSNLIIVLPGKIETKGMVPFVGGVPNDLTLEDAEAIQRRVPSVTSLAPLLLGQSLVSYGSLSRNVPVIGTTYEFQNIRRLSVARGTFLPPGEIDRGSSVCVIGTKLEQELFRGENPLGKLLRVDDWRFRVIGVLTPKGQSMGSNIDDVVMIPAATAMKVYDQTSLFRIAGMCSRSGIIMDAHKIKFGRRGTTTPPQPQNNPLVTAHRWYWIE